MVDFFISYNHHDLFMAQRIKSWIEEVGYSCMMQKADFGTGSNFVLKMDEAAKKAKRTIAILSPNYLSSKFTQPEWAAAFAKDPTGEFQSLIPIRIHECELDGLLSTIVYLDLVGLNAIDMKEKLLADIEAIMSGEGELSTKKMEGKVRNKKPDSNIHQIAKGDGNIQVGRDYIQTQKHVIKNEIVPTSEHITDAQARDIHELIKKWAGLIVKANKGKGYGEAHQKFKNTFRITSYKLVPKNRYNEAIKYLKQQIGQLRPSLRRSNNNEWRKHNYASIYSKAGKLGMSKQEVYQYAFEKLDLDKPISSLKDLRERKLDKLYKLFLKL